MPGMLALLLATLIPVAGTIVNSTTAYSTAFRITNRAAHRQLVRADWIARDGLGSHDGAQLLDLGANETRMIASVFPFAGFPPSLGAVKFTGVKDDGAVDPDASVDASAVIAATRLGDGAQLTQVVPGVAGADMRGSDAEGMVFWPVLVPAFLPANAPRPRANYGIVNDASDANVFAVESRFPVHGSVQANPRTETVTVPPHAMVQRPLLTNGSPVDDEGAIVTIRRLGTSVGVWTAYVSTIDGATGDAVTVPALPRGGKLAVDN
jgi:hypothetical protein